MREGLLMATGRVDVGLAEHVAAEQLFGWVNMLEGKLDGMVLRARLVGLDAAAWQGIVNGVPLVGWRMSQVNHAPPFEVGTARVLMQLSDDARGFELRTPGSGA